jgi:phage terminase large subunit-like protein
MSSALTEVRVDKYSVDDLLNAVDYNFPGYVPSIEALDFINFMQLVLGEPPENKNSMAHYFMMDVIFKNVDPFKYYGFQSDIAREHYFAVMCHREFSKSVLLGSMFTLYMAYHGRLPGFGPVNFGGYIGNSIRGGVRQNMQTIAGVYKDSDYLQGKFERVHFTDTAVKFVRHPKKNAKGEVTAREAKESHRTFVMEGYGAMAGPRGARDGLVRPQFFIIDDVIKNAADARSDVILGNVRSMIEEDIGYALHGAHSFCIYIGTPFNLRDPLMNALIDGTWNPIVFPIAQNIRIDMKKDEFRGSWEDRHSYEKVMIKYRTAVHKGTLPAFMQEQMLRVASEEDRLIPDSYINWFDRSSVLANGHLYNFYITTDFTTTGKRGSDYSAMAVWAINSNGDYMLIDLVVQKLELADQYAKLMDLVTKYKKYKQWIEVGIETSGQQRTHIFALKMLMTKQNNYFTIATQKGKTGEGVMRTKEQGNKFEYFKLMVPAFQNSKMWFANELQGSEDLKELMTELQYLSYNGIGSKHDDALDIISQLSQMNIIIPQYENPRLPAANKDIDRGYWEAEIIEETEKSSYIF